MLGPDFSRFADLIFLLHYGTTFTALVVSFLALVCRIALFASHGGESSTPT